MDVGTRRYAVQHGNADDKLGVNESGMVDASDGNNCSMNGSSSSIHQSMIFERNVQEQVHILNADLDLNHSNTNSLLRGRQNSFSTSPLLQPLGQQAGQRKYSNSSFGNSSLLGLSKIATNGSVTSINSLLQPSFNKNYLAAPSSSTNLAASTHNHHHRHLENFVPPILDASCSIVNDEKTNLADVDMVLPPRPASTLGLDLALGRSKSVTPNQATSPLSPLISESGIKPLNELPRPTLAKSYSYSTGSPIDRTVQSPISLSPSPDMGKTLKFYSYADVLTDEIVEHPQNTQLKLQKNLSNPFIVRRESAPILAQNSSSKRVPSGLFSRSPQQDILLHNANNGKSHMSPRNNSIQSNINVNNPLINTNYLKNELNSKFQLGDDRDNCSSDEEL